MTIKEEYIVSDTADKWRHRCRLDELEKTILRAYDVEKMAELEKSLMAA